MTECLGENVKLPAGELAEAWAKPLDRECLTCYVGRMLADFGCDGTLRWVTRWREIRAPGATALLTRLSARGAECDCGLASRVYADHLRPPPGARPLPCAGVSRRGSTKPCRAAPGFVTQPGFPDSS